MPAERYDLHERVSVSYFFKIDVQSYFLLGEGGGANIKLLSKILYSHSTSLLPASI